MEEKSARNNAAFISISGVAGSGKTTVSEYLKRYFTEQDYKINDFSFAGPLKDAACMWFGWDRQRLDTDFPYKEGSTLDDGSPDPYCAALGMTRRQILQKFGTEGMRHGVHSNFWIIMADLGVRLGKIPPSDLYVISDARFVNELEWAKSINAYRILVTREEIEDGQSEPTKGRTLTSHTTHASEIDFLNWDGYDEHLVNLIDHRIPAEQNMERLVKHLHDFTIPRICTRFNLVADDQLQRRIRRVVAKWQV